jgi:hypothetical protein
MAAVERMAQENQERPCLSSSKNELPGNPKVVPKV